MAGQISSFSPRVAAAFAYALELHGSQVRKRADGDGQPPIPYISHLLAVASLVIEHGGTEDEAIAALLHDGPEDQGGQKILDTIRNRFGDRVADIVAGCSDTLVEDRRDKPEWRVRKLAYLEHLEKTESDSVLLVSMADKVHNLGSILADYRRVGEDLWERFAGKRDGTLWYYGDLLETYRRKKGPHVAGLLEDFERTHAELMRRVEAGGKR